MHGRRKNYRAWDAQQNCQDPVSPRDALPENDLVFFLMRSDPQLDLSPFHEYYARELRGQPPFDVTMMVTLLVYAYCRGRLLQPEGWRPPAMRATWPFRAIVGGDRPDFRTHQRFPQDPPGGVEALVRRGPAHAPVRWGWSSLGNLSTDGTKMGANASRHKAMSYGYMAKEIAPAGGGGRAVAREQAERLDAEQDAAQGSRRWRRTARRIEAARGPIGRGSARRRRGWKPRPAPRRKTNSVAVMRSKPTGGKRKGRKRRGKEPAPIDPHAGGQGANELHRPEAKIMKQSNKGFDYSYNAQAVVDGEEQIIVAAEATQGGQ